MGGYDIAACFLIFFFLFIYFCWFAVSMKIEKEKEKENNKEIKINPYDNLPFQRKLIDRKNKQLGFFDLGNHILIVGLIFLAIFISLNID